MSGLGNGPIGTMPYGVGTPNTSAGNTGKPLVDANGVAQGSRYIDQFARDYVMNTDGRLVGQDNVEHLVLMAVLTVRSSSAVPTLGLEEPSGVIGINFEREREAQVRSAFADLVKRGLITIVSVKTDRTNRPVLTRIVYRDLTTNSEPKEAFA